MKLTIGRTVELGFAYSQVGQESLERLRRFDALQATLNRFVDPERRPCKEPGPTLSVTRRIDVQRRADMLEHLQPHF
jgi:hypothetical protein